MADYLSEQEQIEELKKWWRANGTSTLTGVAIALVSWFGWSMWNSHVMNLREEASITYEKIIDNSKDSGLAYDDKLNLLKSLESMPSGAAYFQLAALSLSKQANEKNKLEDAERILLSVLDKSKDNSVNSLIRFRLAKAQYALAKYGEVLDALSDTSACNEYEALCLEIKGDAHLKQGNRDMALKEYRQALSFSSESGSANKKDEIDLKLSQASFSDSK